uniref:Ubiquitin hydrolase B n=1 Tax=Lygus hesperus TaxID=30085 RepID=A0A0A9X514_LYGHE
MTLVLPRSVCSATNSHASKVSRTYQLFAVVAHRGVGLSQGHYVTYLVRNVANPATSTAAGLTTSAQVACDRGVSTGLGREHVILCNDTSVSVCNASQMYKETVYFLAFQKV